jgi:hypothetical protein
VVFKSIIIRVTCICCGDRCIGMVYIDIIDGQVMCGISGAPVPYQYSLTWTFAQILGRLRPLLRETEGDPGEIGGFHVKGEVEDVQV